MQQFDKWVFPDGEEHLQEWMKNVNKVVDGRLTYQYGKYEMAKPFIKEFGNAVDIGSHIGLWAYFLASDFQHVFCFEPMPEHIECWHENLYEKHNASLWEIALGAEHREQVFLHTRTKGSSGDTQINPAGEGHAVTMYKIDDMDLAEFQFMKIDCEGYEEFILRGATETILRFKPCIVVEQKGDMSKKYGCKPRSAVEYLLSLGAKLRTEVSGDYILSWD